VIKKLGEEKFGKRIAHKILEVREHTPITTTKQLADLVDEAVPVKDKFKHPATRTFQAIRIYINSELEEIQTALQAAIKVLKPGGRLVVISFHSLEDRIVKQTFHAYCSAEETPRFLPIMGEDKTDMKHIKKKVRANKDELALNPRSRSAILRVVEKC
jgi:16S rRNA (cytosine1402-N4)-methyltransferase